MASNFLFILTLAIVLASLFYCDAFYIKPSNDIYDMKYGGESAELDDFDDILTPMEQYRQNLDSYQRLFKRRPQGKAMKWNMLAPLDFTIDKGRSTGNSGFIRHSWKNPTM